MTRVLLVINCQQDLSYQNRQVLQALYGDRFASIAFAVNDSCATDDNFTNIVSPWKPAPLGSDNRCLCSNLPDGIHGIGIHTFHPRLKYVAELAENYELVVFAEDDCMLSPRVTPDSIRELCADADAALPGISFCEPADTSWVWNRYAGQYSVLESVNSHFDSSRLRTHWRTVSGAPICLHPGVPMFASLVDFFIIRSSLLREIIIDLQVLEQMWHEIAIPTAILHHTSRIGLASGLALWGDDRNRSLADLMVLLGTTNWLHPVKLRTYPPYKILDVYRAIPPFVPPQ